MDVNETRGKMPGRQHTTESGGNAEERAEALSPRARPGFSMMPTKHTLPL